MKILIVEDNSELTENIVDWLTSETHRVDSCADGVSALAYMKAYEYDVFIFDWSLPRMSGLEILKQIRAEGVVTPVLMLTGRRDIDDKEECLDAGADDYLTKPFEMRELSARLRAIVRRTTGAGTPNDTLKCGGIVLDKATKRVQVNGNDVKLMRKDFAILELFMSYPNKVFSAEMLIERIWESDTSVTPDVVRKHINRIRTQVDGDGAQSAIRTVHGVGYALNS